ncbi:3-isopropylmalate dehydrogenase [Alphaproteobacteria bacterium]|jgi:3-isopropylmalate dehydrogenase|nr:3-isopropylmalate dehydrogenase [Alphaproteobacteria bacterium]
MSSNKKILILPGDGIGVEVMNEVLNIINWMAKNKSISFDVSERLVGGIAYDQEGDSISDTTMDEALKADAVLFGAVGGSKWDNVERSKRPEAALLRLRKELDLFANLRPAVVFDALANSSSLKLDIVEGLDILILRELTSGVYFGQPRGVEKINESEEKAVDTQSYTTSEVTRIGKVAFDLAKKRSNKVTSVEKSNVMETGMFWRNVITDLHAEEFKDVELHHMLADNCAMQLVRDPKQFDVILTDNLFGDLLSDIAAMLTGSLGMLPSASLGKIDDNGKRAAMYEPVHGSAPDIAGQGLANPLAMIMSFAMMLKYSFDMNEDSALIEQAVQQVLSKGLRTGDIAKLGETAISTQEMGQAVIDELVILSGK